MESCIYEGNVHHRRNIPRVHQFDFRLFLFSFDLNELDTVFQGRWLWSTNRLAMARFRASDHLVKFAETDDLRDRVELTLQESGFDQPIGPVRLVTQLRYFGFAMNPVSFFYCYDPSGSQVTAVIAEVNNTPWGEQHCYVIPADPSEQATGHEITASEIDKTFHVSPFMSMDMSYQMVFSIPNEHLVVKIKNRLNQPDKNGVEKILDVSMALNRRPITSTTLALMLVKYPLYSFRVIAGIYWQALRIYLKQIPFVSHPKNKIGSNNPVEFTESVEKEMLNSELLTDDPHNSEPESVLVSR